MSTSLCKPQMGVLAAPLVEQCAAAGRVGTCFACLVIDLQLQLSFSTPPLRLAWWLLSREGTESGKGARGPTIALWHCRLAWKRARVLC